MKVLQIAIGAAFVVLGLMMLVAVVRNGQGASQGIIAPLGLVGAGALAISAARRKKKKW